MYPLYSGSSFSDEITMMICRYAIHLHLTIRHHVIHPALLSRTLIVRDYENELKRSVKEVPMLHEISFEKKGFKVFETFHKSFWSYIERIFSGLVCIYYRKHLA